MMETTRFLGFGTSSVLALCLFLAGCGDNSTGPSSGPPPTILGVEPSVGTVGTELRVTGLNFRSGANAKLGSLAASEVDVVGGDVFVRIPPGIVLGQTYDLTVTNSDRTAATIEQAFTAVEPILKFVNGATKPSGSPGSTVILEGDAFGDMEGLGRVLFSDGVGGTMPSTIGSPDDWTNTFILTTVPSGAASGPVLVETETGQSSALPFAVTQNATFSPSTISWSETQPLPLPLSGHSATRVPIDNEMGITVERVYVVGGAGNDSIPSQGTYHSAIGLDGSLAGWSSGSALTTGVTHHAAVSATPFNSKVRGSGYLYVIGGIATKGGEPTQDIARIALTEDGSTGVPESVGSLPMPLHSHGVVLFRSNIYIVGGATTGNSPVAAAYRAPVDTLGVIGEWEDLEPLPEARAYHQLVSFGSFLYAVGGQRDAVKADEGSFGNNQTNFSTVAHSRINLRTGLLSDGWITSGSSMQKTRSKHEALAAGGSLFVSSGLYNAAGNGSSENIHATINPDGTLGSFNGATGSNTLQSVGGVNLFNTRGITYVDGDGVAHVMILGGDNVNSPGNKSDKVIFY